jgi:hypothetical protein
MLISEQIAKQLEDKKRELLLLDVINKEHNNRREIIRKRYSIVLAKTMAKLLPTSDDRFELTVYKASSSDTDVTMRISFGKIRYNHDLEIDIKFLLEYPNKKELGIKLSIEKRWSSQDNPSMQKIEAFAYALIKGDESIKEILTRVERMLRVNHNSDSLGKKQQSLRKQIASLEHDYKEERCYEKMKVENVVLEESESHHEVIIKETDKTVELVHSETGVTRRTLKRKLCEELMRNYHAPTLLDKEEFVVHAL